MKHGSLFSGIGGFDLAAEWMGWENIFHCEWNEFGQKVLKHYWPKAISYEDITKTDFTIHRGKIDILTGGFPCQPYSAAGKRLGKEDERHLWPQMLRAIREIKPRWVVGENVYGLVNWSNGLVFHEIQTDLEAQGYEVQPYLLPAVSVNAPHRRDRIWFVAHANSNDRGCICRHQSKQSFETHTKYCDTCSERDATNTNSNRQESCIIQKSKFQQKIGERLHGRNNYKFSNEISSDTSSIGLERSIQTGINDKQGRDSQQRRKISKHIFENGAGIQFKNFPTVSPLCNGYDGFSDRLDGITFPKWRNESIKAGGNAVVPQVVFQIFKTIEQYEILNNVNNSAH